MRRTVPRPGLELATRGASRPYVRKRKEGTDESGRWSGVNIWGSRRQDQDATPVDAPLCTAASQRAGQGSRT